MEAERSGRALPLVLGLSIVLVVAMVLAAGPLRAFAYVVDHANVSSLKGDMAAGEIYITNLSWDNCTFTSLQGGVYEKYMDRSYTDWDGGPEHYWNHLVGSDGTGDLYGDVFTARYSNAGYESDGRGIDVVITCTGVHFDHDCRAENSSFRPFFDLSGCRFGCFAVVDPYGMGRLYANYRIEVVYTGTNEHVQKPMVYWMRDLDVNDTYAESHGEDVWGTYAEGIAVYRGSADGNVVVLADGTRIRAEDWGSDATRFYGYGNLDWTDPDDELNWVAFRNSTGVANVTWFGSASATTELGLRYYGTAYPDYSVSKSPQSQVRYVGDTVEFDVTADMPYTGGSNQPRSVSFSDSLDATALVSDSATVKVRHNGADVTELWSNASSGLNLNLSTTATSNSDIAGELVFHITAKVKPDLDVSRLDLSKHAGYGTFYNQASMNVNGANGADNPKTTNTVEVLVPYWEVKMTKSAEHPDICWDNPLYKLTDGTFELRDASGRAVASYTLSNEQRSNTSFTADSNTVKVYKAGTYKLTETRRPTGFGAASPVTVTLDASNTAVTGVVNVAMSDPPLYVDPEILALKYDEDLYTLQFNPMVGYEPTVELPQGYTQGNVVTFEGTRFAFTHWGVQQKTRPTGTPLANATWSLGSDAKLHFASATPVDGTSWRYRVNGKNVMPLGTYALDETRPVDGYMLPDFEGIARVIDTGNGVAELKWEKP